MNAVKTRRRVVVDNSQLARTIGGRIRQARKAAGLEITDRIRVWWHSDDTDLSTAIAEHGAAIADDVLAISFEQAPASAGATNVECDLPIALALARA